MTDGLSSMLHLFLRSAASISKDDAARIKSIYAREGRDEVEKYLRKEKSNVPFASLLLSELDIDTRYWKSVHQAYVERNTQILDVLKAIFKCYYDKGGKSLCVVENFGSILSSGVSIGCFASNDVDLTADLEEKEFLKEVFGENGFTLNQRGVHPVDNKQISTFFNPDVLDGKGYWLNVMWTPVSRAYLLPQRKTGQRLHIERTLHTELYKDTAIRLLNPTAQVYFCAIHQACEHYYTASPGMSLQCDIDRVVNHRDVDWDKIVRWSDEDEQGCRIAMSLDLCKACLSTPVPLEKFHTDGRQYAKLRKELFVGDGQLNNQLGKMKRLYVELASDDRALAMALISRLWRR